MRGASRSSVEEAESESRVEEPCERVGVGLSLDLDEVGLEKLGPRSMDLTLGWHDLLFALE